MARWEELASHFKTCNIFPSASDAGRTVRDLLRETRLQRCASRVKGGIPKKQAGWGRLRQSAISAMFDNKQWYVRPWTLNLGGQTCEAGI